MQTELPYWLLLCRDIKTAGRNLERIITLVFGLTRFSQWLGGSVHMGRNIMVARPCGKWGYLCHEGQVRERKRGTIYNLQVMSFGTFQLDPIS